MSGYLESFGATLLPTGLPEDDLSTHEARDDTLRLPGGGLYDPYGSARSPLDGPALSKRGKLVGESEADLHLKHMALRARIGERDKLWRRFSDGTRQWCWARLLRVPITAEPKHRRFLEVEMRFQVLSPAWYAETETVLSTSEFLQDSRPFLLTLGVGRNAGTQTLFILNRGTLPITRVVIALTSGTGTISHWSLNNTATGHLLSWSGELEAGEQMVVDTGAGTVRKNGADAYDANFNRPATKANWMELKPGGNEILFSVTDSGNDSELALSGYEYYA